MRRASSSTFATTSALAPASRTSTSMPASNDASSARRSLSAAARRAMPARPVATPFESLEGRAYFAVTALFNLANGGTLAVTGDAGNNAIVVSRDAAGKLKVNNGAVAIAGGTPTAANTKLVTLAGKDGNDTLRLDETNGVLPAAVLDGGNGDDTMIGGSGADKFLGGAGKDLAVGNKGADTALLGAGDDTFVWNPGDGSDKVEGEAGLDALQFNGAGVDEKIDVTNNAGRLKFFRDVGNVTIDAGTLERVNFEAGGGVDTITVGDLSGTVVKEVNLDLDKEGSPLAGTPDHAADKVTVNGRGSSENIGVTGSNGSVTVSGLAATVKIQRAEAIDSLVVKANGGNDHLDAQQMVTPMLLTLDGGTGNDEIDGSNRADLLVGGDGDDEVVGHKGDDKALLGAGNDEFEWVPGDGSDTIEGGTGTDLLDFDGADVDENIDISNNNGRMRFFRNVASVTMDTNDLENVLFEALGGKDNVVVHNLAGTDVKQVKVDLGRVEGGPPDASADTVTVLGSEQADLVDVKSTPGQVKVTGLFSEVLVVGANAAQDKLTIKGQGGNDKINAAALAASAIKYRAEGGSGNDSLTGSQGNDELIGDAGNDSLSGLAGNDLLDGGTGNDVLVGGAGNDTLINGETNTQ